jgi:hypothetical protein
MCVHAQQEASLVPSSHARVGLWDARFKWQHCELL